MFDRIGLGDRHVLGSGVEFRCECLYDLPAVLSYRLKILLAESFPEFVHGPGTLHHQTFAHLVEIVFDVYALALREILAHATLHPVQDLGVLPGEGVEDAVHRLVYKGFLVEIYLIISHLPYLPCEGFECLLEEFVYGAYGEGTVVVEDVAKHLPLVLVGRFRQELDDAALHLCRCLVGEGYGQDVPVCIFPGEQGKVLFCKGVGLARPCGGFENLYHRPQMVLKSQYSQVLLSSVLLHGTSLSLISSRSTPTLSFMRRRNSALAGTLRGF